MSAGDRRGRGGVVAATALVALLAVLQLAFLWRFFHDDAYIALRYAEHCARGLGLVWNPGERVEGYTSLAWVLLCAGLHALGLDLVVAARALGVASLLALCLWLFRRPTQHADGRARRLAVALVATNGSMLAWAIGGLETCLFALLLTAALIQLSDALDAHALTARPYLGAGALLAAAQLARPEGVLVTAVAVSVAGLYHMRRAGPSRVALAALTVPPALALAAHLAFRRAYYGQWLPNTAYAKGGLSALGVRGGLGYLGDFALDHAPWLLLLVYGMLAGPRPEPGTTRERLFGVFALVYTLYVVMVGGDHMPWHRFFVPLLPLLAVLIAGRLRGLPRATALLAFAIAWGMCATVARGLLSSPVGWVIDPAAYRGAVVGRYIADHWPRDSTVALNTAGSTPYYSGLRAIDMLGLNDAHIARAPIEPANELPWAQLPGHRRGDGAYVLSRRPDFVILGGAQGAERPWFSGDKQLLALPGFRRDYRLETVTLTPKTGPPFAFHYYRRVASD